MSFYDPELVEILQGLRRDYDNERGAGLEAIAPVVNHDMLKGSFLVPSYTQLPEKGEARTAGHYATPNADFQAYNEVQYSLSRYMSKEQVVPRRLADLMSAVGIDMLAKANKRAMDEMHATHADNWVTAANTLVAGTAIDLSTDSEQLIGKISADIEGMFEEVGLAPDCVVMNRQVFSKFRSQDEIFNGPALGAAAGRRLGGVTGETVKSFFREQFGLEIFLFDHRTRGGASPYALGNDLILCRKGGMEQDGTFYTAAIDGSLMSTVYREYGAGHMLGGAVVSDSQHFVGALDPELGRKCAVTLS